LAILWAGLEEKGGGGSGSPRKVRVQRQEAPVHLGTQEYGYRARRSVRGRFLQWPSTGGDGSRKSITTSLNGR